MSEKKNNDIKFEDLVDNYTYQQNDNYGQSGGNGQGNGFNPPPFWSQPQPQPPQSHGYNIATLVLGILSIVCCCFYGFISIICGILAIIFFVLSKKNGTSNGMAVAGLICAIFGLVLGLFFGIYILANLDMLLEIAEQVTTVTN